MPSDPGFVVEWQLADEVDMIDLSTAESEARMPDLAASSTTASTSR